MTVSRRICCACRRRICQLSKVTQTKPMNITSHMIVGLSLILLAEAVGQPVPLPTGPSPIVAEMANANYNPTNVTIAWTLSTATNVVQQTVSWGLSPTNYTDSIPLAPNVTTFQITGLKPASTYYIAVMCVQGIGTMGTNLIKSVYSPEIVWTTAPSDRPPPPQNVRVVSSP